MKKLIVCAFFALGTVAFAQSNNDVTLQVGVDNSAIVDQDGLQNDNLIVQLGLSNHAETTQEGWANEKVT